ncbi:MAG TPA: methionyl-tRNA formyltransferase [Dehalococcoidia bacterium]|jgi:methionyl-tRNA formyltransferase|nr:methionyl-tRNA formyltransferase [Dehalococcoidia bacterium]
MRVVFFGSPDYALPTLRALLDTPSIEVVAVVTQPDRRQGRSGAAVPTPVKALAIEADIEVLTPERVRREQTEHLMALDPDVGVVAASGHILPGHLLEAFPHDVLNVHASLLPRHRGASPVAAVLVAGDEETGATIMQVVHEIDAGPVLAQVRTAIGPLDTTETLTSRVAELGATLLVEMVPRWVAGEVEAKSQDASLVSHAPRLSKPDGVIDWSLPAVEIWRRVRAFQPWPLATTRYDGQPFTVHEAWPIEDTVAGEAGFVVAGSGEALSPSLPGRDSVAVVVCGEGALALLSVQRPGKRATPIEQYLNGDRQLIGARLG